MLFRNQVELETSNNLRLASEAKLDADSLVGPYESVTSKIRRDMAVIELERQKMKFALESKEYEKKTGEKYIPSSYFNLRKFRGYGLSDEEDVANNAGNEDGNSDDLYDDALMQ